MRNASGERLKVLLVESGTSVGGTERVVWELATRLSPARYDVHVWLSPVAALDEFAAALASRGLTVSRVAEVDSRWDWRGMLDTWLRLRRLGPALLHVHHVWPAADRYLCMLARAAGVPHVIVTEHIVGEAHSPGQRALKRDELLRADAVTAVCGAVADTLVRDYGIGRDRVRVVPNGAETPDDEAEAEPARAWRERFHAQLIRPLWSVVGRLEEQKGHAVLFQALAELWKRGLDFSLVVAGDGTLRESLQAKAAALGLERKIHFVGTLDDAGPLLAASDAVLLPSLWEGLPLVLLEAMARSRPVIATAVGGVPEVIEHGVHGHLVPPNDPAALADALELFHRKTDRAARMGRAGGELVRRDYSWQAVAGGFEAVYDEALGLATFSPADRPGPGRKR